MSREVEEILSINDIERDETDYNYDQESDEEEFNKFFNFIKRKAASLGQDEALCIAMSRDSIFENWQKTCS